MVPKLVRECHHAQGLDLLGFRDLCHHILSSAFNNGKKKRLNNIVLWLELFIFNFMFLCNLFWILNLDVIEIVCYCFSGVRPERRLWNVENEFVSQLSEVLPIENKRKTKAILMSVTVVTGLDNGCFIEYKVWLHRCFLLILSGKYLMVTGGISNCFLKKDKTPTKFHFISG